MAKKNKIIKKTALQRHKLALKIISENVGDPSRIKNELLKLGYKESYIDSGHLKNTKSWQALMEEHLPDSKIIAAHDKLLNAKSIRQLNFNYKLKDPVIKEIIENEGFKFISTKRFMTTAVVFFSSPDSMAIQRAVDMAYKLKKKYGEETINHKFSQFSDEEIEERLAGAISGALGSIAGATKKKG